MSSLRKDFETEAKRKSGINPNYFHSDTAQTPLEVLCATGDVEAVEWLLHSGAIADIDSEHLRIKLSAAQYVLNIHTGIYVQNNTPRKSQQVLCTSLHTKQSGSQ